jgi:fructuronate reductase
MDHLMNDDARLSLRTLPSLRSAEAPGYAPGDVRIGIVHLGIGAFFRAHAAVYTDDVLTEVGGDWGVCGVSQRSRTVPDQLDPQDGLYTVLERSGDGEPTARVIGSVREVLCAADEPSTVVERIAAPTTKLVTLTVTEKGYRYDPGTGRLAMDDDLAADLAGEAPRTVVGQLVRGMQQRQRTEAGPLTVVSCDNLPENGPLLAGLVHEFIAQLPPEEADPLTDWVRSSAAFPQTMVDRIVPATTDDDRAEIERLLGVRDDGVVVAEPFRQWVIEDAFAGPRPEWERAGAILTDDVGAYERVKLRLLNGTHSTVAYLGAVAGYGFIAEALADQRIAGAARRLITEDSTPTLTQPPGVELSAYGDQVLERFSNAALGHRTTQVAMDGSHKLPQRLLGTARERLAAGAEPRWVALGVAAWLRYLAGTTDAGEPITVDDPLAERLQPLTSADRSASEVTEAVLRIREVFGDDLGEDERFVELVTTWLDALRRHGVLGALEDLAN